MNIEFEDTFGMNLDKNGSSVIMNYPSLRWSTYRVWIDEA